MSLPEQTYMEGMWMGVFLFVLREFLKFCFLGDIFSVLDWCGEGWLDWYGITCTWISKRSKEVQRKQRKNIYYAGTFNLKGLRTGIKVHCLVIFVLEEIILGIFFLTKQDYIIMEPGIFQSIFSTRVTHKQSSPWLTAQIRRGKNVIV